MSEFIIFSDPQFYNNPSKSYITESGLSSWLLLQLDAVTQVFDYALHNNIYTVICAGDIFEEKNRIDVKLYNTVWKFFKDYKDLGICLFICCGNHDRHSLNSSSLLPFTTISHVVDNCGSVELDEQTIIRIIANGKLEGNLKLPKRYKTNLLVTHEDIQGLARGPLDYTGKSAIKHHIFSDWNIVFNGHLHKPQEKYNIVNIGSPLIQDWGEAGDKKRFIHYKDGEVKSININGPKFLRLNGLSKRILDKIAKDNYNFYKIDVTPEEVNHEVFKDYNVIPNIIKNIQREIRIEEDSTIEEDLESYIDIEGLHNLDKDKLLKIGLELIK